MRRALRAVVAIRRGRSDSGRDRLAECRRLHSCNSCVLQPGELWPQPSCESLADFDDEAPPHPPHHPLEQIPPSPPQGHRTAQVRAHAALTWR